MCMQLVSLCEKHIRALSQLWPGQNQGVNYRASKKELIAESWHGNHTLTLWSGKTS